MYICPKVFLTLLVVYPIRRKFWNWNKILIPVKDLIAIGRPEEDKPIVLLLLRPICNINLFQTLPPLVLQLGPKVMGKRVGLVQLPLQSLCLSPCPNLSHYNPAPSTNSKDNRVQLQRRPQLNQRGSLQCMPSKMCVYCKFMSNYCSLLKDQEILLLV